MISHRERVQIALNHESPDRCPMQISFTPEFASRLVKHYGLSNDPENSKHDSLSFELERRMEQDMLLTSGLWDNAYFQKHKAGDQFVDAWGIGWKAIPYNTRFGTGIYTEMIHHPLADTDDFISYNPPDPLKPDLFQETIETIKTYKDEYWIVGVTVTTLFEKAWALRGYEQVMTDMLTQPELVHTLFEIPFKYHLVMAKRLVELGVDMIWIGDDVGAQHSMLIDPDLWRKFLKHKMADFISTLKSVNRNIKIAYHSDGYIYPIIRDLVEIGLDVLNPVQPRSMDPGKLKKEFGKNLCFWGGIDEQRTLPFGSPQSVRKEITDRIATLGQNGGLIIGPTHHVQLDTPLENFFSMIKTITS